MSDTGFDAAPAHYAGKDGGMEAIDLIWLEARQLFGAELGDKLFAVHCYLTAHTYLLRLGKKGANDADKAEWYGKMEAYVSGIGPDPRTCRPGWEPHPDAPRPVRGCE